MKETGRLALDTNAIIAYREGNNAVFKFVNEADSLLIPVTVLGELFYGALNSSQIEQNTNIILKFVEYADVISIDVSIARRYAIVRSYLKNIGCPIPENDIWIAASCLEMDVPLISRDRHFSSIPDLKLIRWDE